MRLDTGSMIPADSGSTSVVDSGSSGNGNRISVAGSGVPTSLPPRGSRGTLTTMSLLAPSFIIGDIDIQIDLAHGCTKDLFGTLTSPTGTSVVIFDLTVLPVCSTGPRARLDNTILDDEASDLITRGSPPFSGRFQPTGNLSDFDGENAEGVWTLTIVDNTQSDSGTLNSWALEIAGI